MHRNRLTGYLAVRYSLLIVSALLVLGWIAATVFERGVSQSTWSDLEAAANLVASEVAPAMASQDRSAATETARRIGRITRNRITLVLPDGKVLVDTRDDPDQMVNHADRPEIASALAGSPGRDSRLSSTRNEAMLYTAVPVRHEGKIVGVARSAKSTSEVQQVDRDGQGSLLIAITLIAALAALVAWFLAARVSRQIQALQRATDLVSRGESIPKLHLPDVEELALMATAINQIAAQLDLRIQRIGQQGHEQQAVLASMVEGVLAIDSDQRLITLNSAAAKLIGSPQADLYGRNLPEIIRNADLRRFVERALESSQPIEDDVVFHADGQRILQARGAALRNSAGQGVGAVIVLNDVTHYRRLETLRRDFVANVSHELKTPIASIKGFVETLLDGALDQPNDARRFLKIIASHAERLNNIIEDLLSLSKIEQSEKTASLPLSTAPLRPILQSALNGCQAQASQRQIALCLECPDMSAQINPPLLEQAVINLIDNAIKYSDPAEQVLIAAAAVDGQIEIAIRDHGCGIAAEHLPRLFERFYRVDRARSRKLGGTGLGLAIVKHIVQAHQGRVSVTSTPGEGSTFTIHLPH